MAGGGRGGRLRVGGVGGEHLEARPDEDGLKEGEEVCLADGDGVAGGSRFVGQGGSERGAYIIRLRTAASPL